MFQFVLGTPMGFSELQFSIMVLTATKRRLFDIGREIGVSVSATTKY